MIHSDFGFELLFGRPEPAELEAAVTALMRPFPAGLLTPVGVVVANPVYAAPAIQGKLTRSAYHGTVIWSWQQAVLAAGLRRQLQRQDLPSRSRSICARHRPSCGTPSARRTACEIQNSGPGASRTDISRSRLLAPMLPTPMSPTPHSFGARSTWRYPRPKRRLRPPRTAGQLVAN